MEEDLSIMGHIVDQTLERGLGEETTPSKMGVPLIVTSGGRAARALYIQGFGALFMVKVNLPLLAPPAPAEQKTNAPVDSEWESARREVLGLESGSELIGSSVVSADVPFDAESVEALKHTLIGTLKNASNIRHLKPDDYVSIAVFGQPSAATVVSSPAPVAAFGATSSSREEGEDNFTASTTKPSPARKDKGSNRRTTATSSGAIATVAAQTGSVLTLRVKNTDVRSFASGKLSLEDFSKKVSMNAYPGNGYGMTSVNSWIINGRNSTQKR
jgi:hypothetical protein